jgi:tRNA threonylcarbamoyladenosine biosynthesis protein TsaB
MINKEFTNILAIETIDKCGSVALLYGDNLLSERILPKSQRSAQSLAPSISELLTESKLRPKDIDKVAVIIGPGSFTGLRVGIVTAKMFAYSVGAEIIGLSTFEVIAFSILLEGLSGSFSIGVDAQRGEAVIQDWQIESGKCLQLSDTLMLSVDDWQQHSIRSGNDKNFILAGPALRCFSTKKSPNIKITEENLFDPHANTAAKLAKIRQPTSDIWTIAPIYARISAVDEKLNLLGNS